MSGPGLESEFVARPRVLFHPKAAEDYTDSPQLGPLLDFSRRRMIVRKFPYSLIYEVAGRELVVLAVAHGRRRPSYWRKRTRKRR